jgi:hypothetical protein
MVFKNVDDVVELVTIQMSTTATALSTEGLESAVGIAMIELGWSFPVTDGMKCLWITKRSVRHASFILWVASAQKFKYKQVNLQQRFEHYEKLIKNMDAEFDLAISSNTNVFANVESYKMFGTAVGAGFSYDFLGRDITYEDLTRYINSGA